jgi:hypothetical protein
MEFFYFPEYRDLPEDEQRAARKKYLDVCDQIVYHLAVAKHPMDEAEMQEIANQTDYYESPYVTIRRLTERLEAQASELVRATARISEVEAQASELVRATARISELAAQASKLSRFQRAAYSMALELNGLRRRRILRLLDRLPFRGDLREQVAPAFMRLRDDSYLFTRNLRGYRLQVGGNLQDVPFASYPLDLRRPGLRGILLAPTVDLPPSQGQLGIEIVTPQNEIILQVAAPASEIDVSQPLQFDFAPIQGTIAGRYWLRVFVRDVDVPIRLFEWRKYRFGGLGPLQTRAFCGYLFEA